MGILAVLATLAMPQVDRLIARSESATCASHLKVIGTAVNLYVQDHDGRFPMIEGQEGFTYYDEIVETLEQIRNEEGFEPPKPLLETLAPYDVTERTLQCPADLRGRNRFKETGSSYQWNPIVDDEVAISPQIYRRRGAFTPRRFNRITLCTDFDPVHAGRRNRLQADGNVRAVYP